ncbi:unnamed protein product [Clonostachys rosea]|uniref:Uncharacterized protein n=1 Tax=Bionectria ochroleuca TaxID=29856 RepID=A0ABY6UJP8_BIOOC|nr:unnamed protein product [Clonostachys rosea]
MEPEAENQEDQIKAGLHILRDGITQLLQRKSPREVLQEKKQDMMDNLRKEVAAIKTSAATNDTDRAKYLLELFEKWSMDQLAKKNNRSVQAAIADGSYKRKTRLLDSLHKETSVKRPRSSKRRVPPKKPTPTIPSGRARKQAVTDPLVGELYLVSWPGAKWYAGLLLPFGDLCRFGLRGDFESAGLLETVPDCFRYDKENKKFLGWATGYEDGGLMVSQRMFPVFYFDDEDDISSCTYGWVLATDLKPFDLDLVASRFHEIIKGFIEIDLRAVRRSPFVFETRPASSDDADSQDNAEHALTTAQATKERAVRDAFSNEAIMEVSMEVTHSQQHIGTAPGFVNDRTLAGAVGTTPRDSSTHVQDHSFRQSQSVSLPPVSTLLIPHSGHQPVCMKIESSQSEEIHSTPRAFYRQPTPNDEPFFG